MDKVKSAACIFLVVLLVLGSFPLASAWGITASPQQNKAGWVAKQFVLSDETFGFDGMPGSLSVTPSRGTVSIMGFGTMARPSPGNTYTFKAKFDSLHAGYGDRAGKILAEAVTPHTALITVKNNKVISATLDGRWNMVTETPI